MPLHFDFTQPPPSAQAIAAWRNKAERASRRALSTAAAGVAVAGAGLAQMLVGAEGTSGVAGILTTCVGLLTAGLACQARARRRKEATELKFFNLDPEQVLVVFVLTQDTRRYAAALLDQKRTVTLAELNRLQVYGRELGQFLQGLPPELKEPMAHHIGFHLFLEPAHA